MDDRVRIVAWNCLQGLERKAEPLLQLRPDVAVIAECGNEPQLGASYLGLAADSSTDQMRV